MKPKRVTLVKSDLRVNMENSSHDNRGNMFQRKTR